MNNFQIVDSKIVCTLAIEFNQALHIDSKELGSSANAYALSSCPRSHGFENQAIPTGQAETLISPPASAHPALYILILLC